MDKQADVPARDDCVNLHLTCARCHPTFGRGGSYQCMGQEVIEIEVSTTSPSGARACGRSAVFRPATCSFRFAMICPSVCLLPIVWFFRPDQTPIQPGSKRGGNIGRSRAPAVH